MRVFDQAWRSIISGNQSLYKQLLPLPVNELLSNHDPSRPGRSRNQPDNFISGRIPECMVHFLCVLHSERTVAVCHMSICPKHGRFTFYSDIVAFPTIIFLKAGPPRHSVPDQTPVYRWITGRWRYLLEPLGVGRALAALLRCAPRTKSVIFAALDVRDGDPQMWTAPLQMSSDAKKISTEFLFLWGV